MVITAANISPWVAIAAGILILIIPRLLNYIIAVYLIFVGFVQLNDKHHWIRLGSDLQQMPKAALMESLTYSST